MREAEHPHGEPFFETGAAARRGPRSMNWRRGTGRLIGAIDRHLNDQVIRTAACASHKTNANCLMLPKGSVEGGDQRAHQIVERRPCKLGGEHRSNADMPPPRRDATFAGRFLFRDNPAISANGRLRNSGHE
jgi:hypothetical protein